MIEQISAKDDKRKQKVTLVNEDGKILTPPLPLNVRATVDYSFNGKHFPLVGTVVVLYGWKTVSEK